MEAIARSYGEDEEDYVQGISWMERAVEVLLQECRGTALEVDAYLLARISEWKLHLGDVSAAHEIAYE